MAGAVSVTVDFERGEVVLGSRCVCLEPVGQPYRFRLTGGVIVRAVTFEERSRAVRKALIAPDPAQALIDTLRALAMEGAADAVTDAVVLALAGGSEDAPGFDECAVAAARMHGWDWTTLNQAPAIEVDRVLANAPAPAQPGGWMRFVFAAADAGDLDQLLPEMAERLLERGIGRPHERQAGEAVPWHASPAKDLAVGAQSGTEDTPRQALYSPTPVGPAIDPARISASAKPRFPVLDKPLAEPPARPHASSPPLGVPPVAVPEPLQAVRGAAAALRTRVLLNPLDTGPPPESGAPRVSVRVIEPAPLSAPPALSAPHQASGMDSPATTVAPPHARTSLEYPAPVLARPSSAASRPTPAALALETRAALAPLPQPQSHPAHGSAEPASQMPGWLAEIARALADECDLRGIDA
jgi:hypothetical protein